MIYTRQLWVAKPEQKETRQYDSQPLTSVIAFGIVYGGANNPDVEATDCIRAVSKVGVFGRSTTSEPSQCTDDTTFRIPHLVFIVYTGRRIEVKLTI